jgi:hypothetical protein
MNGLFELAISFTSSEASDVAYWPRTDMTAYLR